MNRISPNQIADFCQRALCCEVAVTPKPGLVDRHNSGAHTDMDFHTFVDSATALGPYFQQVAQLAAHWEELPANALLQLRPLGLLAEEAMYAATGGVNTHKGAIFSLGILCGAAAHLSGRREQLDPLEVCQVGAAIALEAQGDFQLLSSPNTTGERLYLSHNITGVRGEAASGFPAVRHFALPVLRELLGQGISPHLACLQALLHLMSQVTDTNVIARKGFEALQWVQQTAKDCLATGGALAPDGIQQLEQLDREFTEKNISPGGCADLLAIAIFLTFLEDPQWREPGSFLQ